MPTIALPCDPVAFFQTCKLRGQDDAGATLKAPQQALDFDDPVHLLDLIDQRQGDRLFARPAVGLNVRQRPAHRGAVILVAERWLDIAAHDGVDPAAVIVGQEPAEADGLATDQIGVGDRDDDGLGLPGLDIDRALALDDDAGHRGSKHAVHVDEGLRCRNDPADRVAGDAVYDLVAEVGVGDYGLGRRLIGRQAATDQQVVGVAVVALGIDAARVGVAQDLGVARELVAGRVVPRLRVRAAIAELRIEARVVGAQAAQDEADGRVTLGPDLLVNEPVDPDMGDADHAVRRNPSSVLPNVLRRLMASSRGIAEVEAQLAVERRL
ncbi:hypothetical protein D3C80_966170 [compost metagenome]